MSISKILFGLLAASAFVYTAASIEKVIKDDRERRNLQAMIDSGEWTIDSDDPNELYDYYDPEDFQEE